MITSFPSVTLRQTVRRLPADMDTPISLFLGLCRDRQGILLESAEVDGRWGRYSVLAGDFLLTARCHNARLALDVADERLAALATLQGMPFLDGIRALMRGLHIEYPAESGLPPISRALYGYFGYGMAGLFNPKLASCLPVEKADACLVLPGTVLIFDHLYNQLFQTGLGELRDVGGAPSCPADTVSPVGESDVRAEPGREGYMETVNRIKTLLRRGEAIQVVPSCRFSAPFSGNPFTLYRRMRRLNPSPYMVYMDLPDLTLVCSSPEVMVRCTDGLLQLSPIAGTRRRGRDDIEDAQLAAELREDPKERAEHVMLVDLGRNDLGSIARPGTVQVERLMEVERFSHVMHLTSRISARLRPELDALDVLAATFPAGTVSGAPKVRAMEIIAEMKQVPRGPYAGCMGWIGLDQGAVNLDTGITIRSMWLKDGRINWQAGGGIVHDSDPEAEWNEVRNKSAAMRAVLNHGSEDHVSARR